MTKRYLRTPEEVIDALQAGNTLTDGITTWKMCKGWLVRYGKRNGWSIGDTITSCYDVYIKEPEPLKLEVGKCYKTLDGRKAWVVEYLPTEYTFPFRVAAQKEYSIYTVTKEGRRYSECVSGLDLVAPWEEEA